MTATNSWLTSVHRSSTPSRPSSELQCPSFRQDLTWLVLSYTPATLLTQCMLGCLMSSSARVGLGGSRILPMCSAVCHLHATRAASANDPSLSSQQHNIAATAVSNSADTRRHDHISAHRVNRELFPLVTGAFMSAGDTAPLWMRALSLSSSIHCSA
jgi:hypothetical protein